MVSFERVNIGNIVQSYMASVRFSFFFHTIIKLLWWNKSSFCLFLSWKCCRLWV